jgi:type VI secretion system secreted protein VgrG
MSALDIFADDEQHNRLLRMRFPEGDAPPGIKMLVNTFDGHESLSQGFLYTVGVLSDDASIDLALVVGKMVTIDLVREDGTLRHFNGYVFEFGLLKTDGGVAFYKMLLEPALSYLRLRKGSAAFHGLTTVALASEVLRAHPKIDWDHQIKGADPEKTYVCQHNETDHNFLHRQWEAQGWHYCYEHRADGHTLHLRDDSTGADTIPGERREIAYRSSTGSSEGDGIHAWSASRRVASDRVSLISFDFKVANPERLACKVMEGAGEGPGLEVYENTGNYGFPNKEGGDILAQRRLEELENSRLEHRALGNNRFAEPGKCFDLGGHFSDIKEEGTPGPARSYLIVAVHHEASNNYHIGAGAHSMYRNHVSCVPAERHWRPGRGHHSMQPTIQGVQTAIVVGPPGEEIHTDGYGRVKVQFHWDRVGKYDERSSPWVRVVSGWAGSQFGQISLPRVGMEVVVQFLDGNIDHPLITGTVYNQNNMPPWPLPENRTQSGIMTRSTSKGGQGHANALRFEDKRGAEELWMHAEKDQRIEVEHNESHWVGNDRRKAVDRDEQVEVKRDRVESVGNDERITVGHNRAERVGADERIDIGNNRVETVGNNESVVVRGMRSERVLLAKEESIGLGKALSIGGVYQVSVAGAMNRSVGMSSSEQVAGDKRASVGSSYSIDAGNELSINVGAASLRMSSDGTISLVGTKIMIEATGQVVVNGKNVDINSAAGAKQDSHPGGPDVHLQAAPRQLKQKQADQPNSMVQLKEARIQGGKQERSGNRPGTEAGNGAAGKRPFSEKSPYSAEEQKQISAALDDAEKQLVRRRSELRRWNQKDKDSFFETFGTDSEQARDLILKRTERVLALNALAKIEDFSPANKLTIPSEIWPRLGAYVGRYDDEHEVSLGPAFWAATAEEKARMLNHEFSHFDQNVDCIPDSEICGTVDGTIDPITGRESTDESDMVLEYYGPDESRSLPENQSIYHADTFSYYLSGGSIPRKRPTRAP